MIKELLRLISQDNMNLKEIAQQMNLSRDDLRNRIDMMIHMGYLELVEESRHGECAFCSIAKACKENCRDGIGVRVYRLTEKGRRVIGI